MLHRNWLPAATASLPELFVPAQVTIDRYLIVVLLCLIVILYSLIARRLILYAIDVSKQEMGT